MSVMIGGSIVNILGDHSRGAVGHCGQNIQMEIRMMMTGKNALDHISAAEDQTVYIQCDLVAATGTDKIAAP